MEMKDDDYEYCKGCEFAYLCFGVDTNNCESYKRRMLDAIKREVKDENND